MKVTQSNNKPLFVLAIVWPPLLFDLLENLASSFFKFFDWTFHCNTQDNGLCLPECKPQRQSGIMQNSSLGSRIGHNHKRSQEAMVPQNILAYLVILCFEKRRPKQKYCCSSKVKHLGLPEILVWLRHWWCYVLVRKHEVHLKSIHSPQTRSPSKVKHLGLPEILVWLRHWWCYVLDDAMFLMMLCSWWCYVLDDAVFLMMLCSWWCYVLDDAMFLMMLCSCPQTRS